MMVIMVEVNMPLDFLFHNLVKDGIFLQNKESKNFSYTPNSQILEPPPKSESSYQTFCLAQKSYSQATLA